MLRMTWAMALTALLAVPHGAQAGWPFFAENGVRKGTEEYYEMRAGEPVGSRQVYHYGKVWPVQPRPSGPPLPLAHRYHHTHYWPHPYDCWDRTYVQQVWSTQRMAGWQSATTLYDYHFDPQTQELNSAGRTHLQWIAMHVPEQYRQAYVATASDPALNGVRMLSVERELGKLPGGERSLPISLRVTDPLGRPALEVEKILETAQDNMMAPIIQYNPGGGISQ